MPTYTTNLALIKPTEGEQALISQINSNMDALDSVIGVIQNRMYPVGSIYMSVSATNPGGLLGGTWVAWGQGRVPVGVNSSGTFNTVEKTGGAETHTLTTAELAAHTHVQNSHTHGGGAAFGSGVSSNTAQVNTGGTGTVVSNGDLTTNGGAMAGMVGASSTMAAISYIASAAVGAGAWRINWVRTGNTAATTAVNQNAGGGAAHNNLQPYITCYMWKRTA